jgi:hypothetical protein
MRGLFHRTALRWRRSGSLSTAEARALVRTMRGHRHAVLHGDEVPMVPKLITRRVRSVVLWSLFRVSIETPGLFVLGVLCIPVAFSIALYQLLAALAAWLSPHLSLLG